MTFEELAELAEQAPAGFDILSEILSVAGVLLQKNIAYGNSALNPINVFAKQNAKEQLYSRIDDKLTRIANSQSFGNEDAVLDLIGYLVLLRIAERVNYA